MSLSLTPINDAWQGVQQTKPIKKENKFVSKEFQKQYLKNQEQTMYPQQVFVNQQQPNNELVSHQQLIAQPSQQQLVAQPPPQQQNIQRNQQVIQSEFKEDSFDLRLTDSDVVDILSPYNRRFVINRINYLIKTKFEENELQKHLVMVGYAVLILLIFDIMCRIKRRD